jgi:ion channel POLLUX/CASTOR
MPKPSFGDRLRYRFDNIFSRGTAALIGLLALASLGVIVVISLVVKLAGLAPDIELPELVWKALMRTLDAGTMGGDGGTWPYLFAMLAVTLGGIFIISSLIGILTTGLEGRLDSLRKGRSKVVESDHTVILGWSPLVFPIISELIIANANRRRACIVVLGDRDKIEMEDEIREKVGATGKTRIVCRTGKPIDIADLQIASLPTARSIIVIPPEDEFPDAQVIKTLLAITNASNRRPEPYHIVAALRDQRAVSVARMVIGSEVEIVLAGDVIARIIAQTCRQAGLSSVYTELLDFGGSEFYFVTEPGLVGKTYGEALSAYETSTVAGICPQNGVPQLNPPMETRIAAGDQLVVIAEDDDTTHLSDLPGRSVNEAAIRLRPATQPAPERTLLLGWNKRAPTIVTELDSYVPPGSQITVVADHLGGEAELQERGPALRNQTCVYQQGDTTDRPLLDALGIETYDHVILLCYSDDLSVQQADARTILTLLHLRDIAERSGNTFSITSEMLDPRDRELAEVAQADDFIVSDRLVSLMLAQVSENKALNAVFADLFNAEGAEAYLKPLKDYVSVAAPSNFGTVVEAARRRGETAIGYRIAAKGSDKANQYGVVINPPKSAPVTFAEDDRVIVLAES